MTLTDEQIKQRDAAYEEWVSARSPTLRTRHNEVIHNVRNERPEASAACGGSRSIDVLGQEATGK